jgi:beta-lactamase class A
MGCAIEKVFADAGCDGWVCAQPLDGSGEVAIGADEPMVAASVIKVPIAVEVAAQFAEGRLNPRERVVLRADHRAPGPVGISLYADDVEASLRDLVVAMLTLSDNCATDALLSRVGPDAVNARMARLGLTGTVVEGDYHTLLNSIGPAAGFADWAALMAWASQQHPQAEEDEVERRAAASATLTPARTNRTTPRDMAVLLRLIWSDRAAPAPACRRIRQLMAQQLTKHRLAAAFPPPAKVAAKSGSLLGVVRHEAGMVTYPDGRGYAVAVFTRARRPGTDGHAVNAAIAAAASAAVTALG